MSAVKLTETLRETVPAGWLPDDNQTLFFYVKEAKRAAANYGLKRQDTLVKFIYIGAVCCPFFWAEEYTKSFLNMNSDDPDTRFLDFYALFKRASNHADVPWVLPED